MTAPTARFRTLIGTRLPGGATWSVEGTNFSVYSPDARNMELRLYEKAESTEPIQAIALDPNTQRTFFAWHVFVEQLPVGIYYIWRVQRPDGSWWEVLDPWALAVSDANWDRRQAISAANGLRGIVTDTSYDWSETAFTPKSLDGAVIYEAHVGGYTRHPSSGTQNPGTFAGLIEKIPYLIELGITHIELLLLVYCLEYWVRNMRVDGFRFDLASVFARGENGAVLTNPSLPWSIELSNALAQTPIIAEAWDAAGLYQVGSFPGSRWSEWNGRYRDVIRRFIRGDRGLVGEVATCLAGSSDLYADEHRLPTSSINFITCHDGFTLWDLVSYNHKHNLANGENNRDGTDQNLSWNCGIEGETADLNMLALRRRQARNFMAILFLSQGVPMLLAGDEFLHTQRGNNNAWCQNNEISWLDWRLAESNHEMIRFVRELLAFRHRHPCLTRSRFFTGQPESSRGIPDITWHGLRLNEPLWGNNDAQVLAFTIAGNAASEEDLHIVLNMSDQDIEVRLPNILQRRWHLAIDTAAIAPNDIIEQARQRSVDGDAQPVHARSVIVFEAQEIQRL